MKNLKVVGAIIVVVLLALNVYITFDNWYDTKGYDKELEQWRGAYEKLNSRHDSLVQSYEVSLGQMRMRESLFMTALEKNSLEYEKIIAGFDTLSVDDHIRKLSKFLSEKDSIR